MKSLQDRLADYLYRNRIEHKFFAKKANVSASAISRLLRHGYAGRLVTERVEAALAECEAESDGPPSEESLAHGDLLCLIGGNQQRIEGLEESLRNQYTRNSKEFGEVFDDYEKMRRRLTLAMWVGTAMWLGLLVYVIVR